MDRLRDVSRYLDLVNYRMSLPENRREFGRAPFVTISRQAGADGHRLAEILALRLRGRGRSDAAWEVFDRALFRMIADDRRLKVSMKYLVDEEYHGRIADFFEQTFGWWTPQDVVLHRIFHHVRLLAGAGRTIIVGRAGAPLTRDLPGGIHVRLVASRERRLERIRQRSGLSEEDGLRRLAELESGRRRLVEHFFKRDVADPMLYDAVFNEDHVTLEEVADWIVAAADRKTALLAQASQLAASRA
jgi:hypothetical protein